MNASLTQDPRFFQAELASIPKAFSDLLAEYSKIPRDQQIEHVVSVRNKAYAVHPYPCLGRFRFVDLNLADHPLYHSYILPTLKAVSGQDQGDEKHATQSNGSAPDTDLVVTSSNCNSNNPTTTNQASQKENANPSPAQELTPAELTTLAQGPIYLDLSSCLSQDTRKLAHDGVPPTRLFASDITEAFIPLGHELFRDAHILPPSHFLVPADVLCPPSPPQDDNRDEDKLHLLDGKVDIINATSVFHLFGLEDQKTIAERCLHLLRRAKSTVSYRALIVGGQAGNVNEGASTRRNGKSVYRHNLASWKGMWEDVVFRSGDGGDEVQQREGVPEVQSKGQWKDLVKSIEVDGTMGSTRHTGLPPSSSGSSDVEPGAGNVGDRYVGGQGDGKTEWNSMVVGRYEDGARWHVFWVWVEFY